MSLLDHGALVDPIFAYVNKSLKDQWAALAYQETGSPVTQARNHSSIFRPPHPHPNSDSRCLLQHALEKPEESARTGSLTSCSHMAPRYLARVAKNQWGSYCIQHKHGSEKHRQMALKHPLTALLEFATNEQVSKSVVKEGGKETLDRGVQPVKGSELIASVLLTAKKDRGAALYDCIRAHIVALCARKTGSKVICVLHVHPIQFILNPLSSVGFSSDRMRAYCGY
ncbi:hypothetical protein B0H14DRAFT_2639272 [Mycena olivaceomarginata]|nr:hypothetical protein B0H14DRAFT_2639272 [Mycena olivaceomarginata]